MELLDIIMIVFIMENLKIINYVVLENFYGMIINIIVENIKMD